MQDDGHIRHKEHKGKAKKEENYNSLKYFQAFLGALCSYRQKLRSSFCDLCAFCGKVCMQDDGHIRHKEQEKRDILELCNFGSPKIEIKKFIL